MTLSSSLSNALTGLNAAARAAEVVSANVANAMTPGYARREIALSSQSVGAVGAGVQVDGVLRHVDERALSDRREAEAGMRNAADQSDAWMRIETSLGYPTETGSLTDRINTLEAKLIAAASRPDETVRLDNAVSAAASVVDGIRSTAGDIQDLRIQADADINAMVSELNANLKKVESLNWQIFRMGGNGQETAGLLDQRQVAIDAISGLVPVKQVPRDGGKVALYSIGGAILLDGPAGELSFTPSGMIVPDMTMENGALSGLFLNGNPLDVGAAFDPIAGGALSAAFDIRDKIAPDAQAGLDALARDLVERFQDPSLDSTLAVGDPGLFTDGGAAFDPADESGLANRIGLNADVDSTQGGSAWRLRDGLGATAPGEVGYASLLTNLGNRLAAGIAPATGVAEGLERSLSAHASDLLSMVSSAQSSAEEREAFDAARVDVLSAEVMRGGVDTDDEMQQLLLIEQAYGANARVIQTVNALMQQLLEI